MANKAHVKYSTVQFSNSENPVEGRAYVVPVDHTSPYVTNGEVALTSPIVDYDETTGIFETMNTIYIPE